MTNPLNDALGRLDAGIVGYYDSEIIHKRIAELEAALTSQAGSGPAPVVDADTREWQPTPCPVCGGFCGDSGYECGQAEPVTVTFEIWQDDICVAMSDDESDAWHYAMMYGQDGPVIVYRVENKRTALESFAQARKDQP